MDYKIKDDNIEPTEVLLCPYCAARLNRVGKGFDNLWARGYYCGSAGHVSQEQVKRYIQEQDGKDVFEYDIFNCPEELKGQLKIGDFSNG